MSGDYRASSLSARCLKDDQAPSLPTVNTEDVSGITANTATAGGIVVSDGGSQVTARGVCWSTNQSPTLNDDFTTDGSGTGTFVSNLSGLSPSTTYYVRAYATNSVGTAYGNQVSFTTTSAGFVCGNTLTINHIAGEVAPVNKTVNYGTVETNLTGSNKCWITQNLGADRQALAATDDTEASAGWYWQFNRKQGFMHDGNTLTPNNAYLYNIDENNDWLMINDPCNLIFGMGWRMLTYTEWENARITGGWDNIYETFSSVLKLHAAGYLLNGTGNLSFRGSYGNYWSSKQETYDTGWMLGSNAGFCNLYNNSKSFGHSLRCIKD